MKWESGFSSTFILILLLHIVLLSCWSALKHLGRIGFMNTSDLRGIFHRRLCLSYVYVQEILSEIAM
ncbi:hypothetical protein AKJ16_DCAP13759 [Drosera capensis]